jgi:hypothetical protein
VTTETHKRQWSTISCITEDCGATTTIDPAAVYHTVPVQVWRCNPATSEVWLQESVAWICDPCWEQLPDE